MATIKTAPNEGDASAFIAGIADQRRREESAVVAELMRAATGSDPVMYGSSIVGFGIHRYENAAGEQKEWFRMGFSPRKAQLTLYLSGGFDGLADELDALGPHSTAKSCLYIKKLDAIDGRALKRLLVKADRLLG